MHDCFRQSTNFKIQPFPGSDKDLLEKNQEISLGEFRGPSMVFSRKAVVDETFIRKSTNPCKSVVGKDASQLHSYSMYQPVSNGLYTRREYDNDPQCSKSRGHISRSFENMFFSYSQRTRADWRIESNFTTDRQKQIDCFSVDRVCNHCYTVSEATKRSYQHCPS